MATTTSTETTRTTRTRTLADMGVHTTHTTETGGELTEPTHHITYRGTRVVSWNSRGVVLRTSDDPAHRGGVGWRTPTTKKRINQAAAEFGLGFTLRKTRGRWIVTLPDGRECVWGGRVFAFTRDESPRILVNGEPDGVYPETDTPAAD